MRVAEQRELRARVFRRTKKRPKLTLDAVDMAVGHKDTHTAKFQRQALRDSGREIAVSGNIKKFRLLKGIGQVLSVGHMVAQMQNGVRALFFYRFAREAETPVRI